MKQDKLKLTVKTPKERSGRDDAVKLGDVLYEFMDNKISPRRDTLSSVDKLLDRLLPQYLRHRCSVAGVTGGQLEVHVDSAAYIYELTLRSSELLEQLRRHSLNVQIKKIHFRPRSSAEPYQSRTQG